MTAPVSDERVSTLVRTLRAIPDDHRTFEIPSDVLTSQFRIQPAVRDMLLDHGIPRLERTDGVLFDFHDLLNVSLDLGLRSVWVVGIRAWPKELRLRDGVAARYEVGYRVTCPDPAHEDPCQVEVLTPDGWVGHTLTGHPVGAVLDTTTVFHLDDRWPALPGPLTALLDEIGALTFKRLPESLVTDLDFIRRTGIADCVGAAHLIVKESRRLGYTARFCCGLVVCPPFASRHSWAELEIDGTWVPVDPLMVSALVKWGLLDGESWPPHRSMGAILGRLSETLAYVGRHNGSPFELSLPTTRLPS